MVFIATPGMTWGRCRATGSAGNFVRQGGCRPARRRSAWAWRFGCRSMLIKALAGALGSSLLPRRPRRADLRFTPGAMMLEERTEAVRDGEVGYWPAAPLGTGGSRRPGLALRSRRSSSR
jgi:hypothetical protein